MPPVTPLLPPAFAPAQPAPIPSLSDIYGDEEPCSDPSSPIWDKQIHLLLENIRDFCNLHGISVTAHSKVDPTDYLTTFSNYIKTTGRSVLLYEQQSPEFFRGLKQNIEEICNQLRSEEIDLPKKIKVMKDLLPQLTMCAPGAYTTIDESASDLTPITTIADVLADLRRQIIRQLADKLVATKNISNSLSSHLNVTLLQYAINNNWNPRISAETNAITDSFQADLNLSPNDIQKFHQDFLEHYSIDAIIEALIVQSQTDLIAAMRKHNIAWIEEGVSFSASFGAELNKDTLDRMASFQAELNKNTLDQMLYTATSQHIYEESETEYGVYKLTEKEKLRSAFLTLLTKKNFFAEKKVAIQPLSDPIRNYFVKANLHIIPGAPELTYITQANYFLKEGVEEKVASSDEYYGCSAEVLQKLIDDPKILKNKFLYPTLFYLAIEKNLVEVIEILLSLGVDPNQPLTARGVTPLFLAASLGHLASARILVDHGADINKRTKQKNILEVALENRHLHIVDFLFEPTQEKIVISAANCLEAAAAGNLACIQKGREDHIPLPTQEIILAAAENGHSEIVKYLIPITQTSVPPVSLLPPLYAAAKNGHLACMQLLLDKEMCRINYGEVWPHTTTLISFLSTLFDIAIETANPEIITEIKKAIACRKRYDFDFSTLLNKSKERPGFEKALTPFEKAVYEWKTKSIVLLLKLGAARNQLKIKNKALWQAVEQGNLPLVKELITHGAEPHKINKEGDTLLTQAVTKGYTEIARYLLEEAKVDINHRLANDQTALHMAAQQGNVEMINLLLQHGANAAQQNKFGETPLYVATKEGHLEATKALLNNKKELINQVVSAIPISSILRIFRSDKNPLMFLSWHLLTLNQLKNLPKGYTPLLKAAENGHTQVVQVLLEAGAYINQTLPTGATALSLAARKDDTHTALLLIDHYTKLFLSKPDIMRRALKENPCLANTLAEYKPYLFNSLKKLSETPCTASAEPTLSAEAFKELLNDILENRHILSEVFLSEVGENVVEFLQQEAGVSNADDPLNHPPVLAH